MSEQVRIRPEAEAPLVGPKKQYDRIRQVTPDIASKRLVMVNVVFIGGPEAKDREWVLVDAGLPGTAGVIARAAAQRFGNSRPAAILLTHGHIDHVGALHKLAAKWEAPIFAHPLEHPFLNGASAYPAADPTVGGGLMSALSPLFPDGPFDFRPWLRELPQDGQVPAMPGWRWLHTPGHSAGHVSFWRESDRSLIAGDAFITTKQESAYSVAVQRPEIHGPPQYYTPDWVQAGESVRRLAPLEPELVVTGHGPAMRGPIMRSALHVLARNFESIAVPAHGRYVPKAA